MAVSFGVMDWIAGGVIAGLILLNISVGTWTEWEAEKIVANLAVVGAPTAVVLRHANGSHDAQPQEIAVEDVVPGDIVLLKNGDIVPADGRVLEGLSNLEADEAFLTGESLPVTKQSEPVDEDDCPVGDRLSMVFSGAMITKGRASVVVTGTGMSTEIGNIARALQSKGERTETGFAAFWYWCLVKLGLRETSPLQYRLNSLAFALLAAAIVTAIVVLASTGFSDIPRSMATYTVAAAVSMLPVSMVAVVSLTLAQASAALAKEHVLVRRMDAIEALAGIDNVCSDKTGTLTVGRMVVRKMWVPSDEKHGATYTFKSGSDPFKPEGDITREGENAALSPGKLQEAAPELHALAMCTALCNQAVISPPRDAEEGWQANGDPTETALQVASYKMGYPKPALTGAPLPSDIPTVPINSRYEQVVEHPFDSSVKRMSIAYANGGAGYTCFLKGAVERILDCCTTVAGAEMTSATRKEIMRMVESLASQGLRVLSFATKTETTDVTTLERDEFEATGWTFLGLAGIYDPPREESAGAVDDCHVARITPRMLTGDHPSTATAIALTIGILPKTYPKSAVMTGQQFDALSNAEVDALPDLPLVVARCAPETKVRMVDALHRRGQTTAMTGDGVNDSPALKRADVGVAMGTGSDVAKQSARIVLTDDNFASIINAISKGRNVFMNLSKFLLYLLSGNVGQLTVMLIGLVFQDQDGYSVFPLSPVSALWVNTLTAGPPAMALGIEPPSPDAMTRPPGAYRTILTREFTIDLFFYGLLLGAQSLVNFVIVMYGYFPGDFGHDCNEQDLAVCNPVFRARATCMATLQICMLLHAFQCKHATISAFKLNLAGNKMLLWCVLVLVASTFPIMYIPVINNKVFLIGPMKWEWGIVFAQIFVYLGASEGYKWGKRVLFRKKGVNVPMAAGMKDPEAQQRLSISSKATVREK
jgi:potassium/sodium efflux P-type ATPase